MNLSINARDAMPSGGKLTIQTDNVALDAEYVRQHPEGSTGRHVMLTVTDTGIGMTEEVRDHIFEPFFTTKEVGKGTGMGLAMCYGIVRGSGGHIVVSRLSQGTSFKVYLPVTEDTYEAQPEKPNYFNPRGNETVMVVEDEPSVRSMMATAFPDQGYEVLVAGNGEEALRVFETNSRERIELLITDVVMPQMGGPELAERLHDARPDIKVLFTSGYTGSSHLNTLAPGTEFLAKPYLPSSLTIRVRELLDNFPIPV